MSFDLPFLPTVLPTVATGASTGEGTAVSAAGQTTGMGDFASLLSGLSAAPGGDATTVELPDIVPQTVLPQAITPQDAASPILMPPAMAVPLVDAPQVMPVTSTLLQAQLPAVAPQVAPASSDVLPANENVLPRQTVASDAVSEALPTEVTSPDTLPVSQPQTKPAKAATPLAAQAEVKVPASVPAAVTVAATPETVVPVVVPPVTATGKPEKNVTSEEITVTDDEARSRAADTPSAASDMTVIVPPVAPASMPVSVPASQPVAVAPDERGTPAPVRNQTPGQSPAPQAPIGKNLAASNNAQSDLPASEGQASAAPKFASLLNAVASPRQDTPAAVAGARIESDTPPVKSGMPAPQAAPTVQTSPVQAPALPQNQAASRKVVAVSGESVAEIASPPVPAAPSGFSLVSTSVSDAGGSAPAAPTPQTPATSLLSQTAVDNINALSVQINKRNAEGATKFTMELHPADLGKVEVALSIGRDGKMMAHMTFDSDMTAAAFSARESDLRQQLSATGLKLSDESLSFSTRLKTDAVAQAQSQAVNANARSADDPSSGNSSQQQNAFTQADSQQGQPRSHSQHLAQMASRQAAADQAAADADLDALNRAIDASAARLKYRQSSSRLALDLSV